jgi:uncharacterized protein (DUF1330 family)
LIKSCRRDGPKVSNAAASLTLYTVTLAVLAGAALGAAAIQALHAQVKPPAYLVIDVDVTDPELYAQYQAARPLQTQYSARFIALGGKTESFAGEPPKRAVIAAFDSLEKAQALRDSAAYKELVSVRDRAYSPRAAH